MDILIKRTEDGRIETKVYRKETHTDRYLNYNSFHHKSQKISVVDALVFRAFKICSPIHLENELNHIRNVLIQNNYPENFINIRISRMRTKFTNSKKPNSQNQYVNFPNIQNNSLDQNPLTNSLRFNTENDQNSVTNQSNEEGKEEHWVPLPYIGNISNKVGGFLRNKLKWKVTFTPGIKIQNMLNGIKDKENKEPAGIYSVPCNSCNETYIGESKRVAQRLEEHKGNVRRYEYNKSAIARHTIRNRKHEINWPNSKLMLRENKQHLRKIKEGLAIQQHQGQLMNIDKGLILSNAWKPIIPKISDITHSPTQIQQKT